MASRSPTTAMCCVFRDPVSMSYESIVCKASRIDKAYDDIGGAGMRCCCAAAVLLGWPRRFVRGMRCTCRERKAVGKKVFLLQFWAAAHSCGKTRSVSALGQAQRETKHQEDWPLAEVAFAFVVAGCLFVFLARICLPLAFLCLPASRARACLAVGATIISHA